MGKKRSSNSKGPSVVLRLPLPYDCSIVVTVEAHCTLLIPMEKENACLRAQKHKADSSYHGMTALGTAQGCMDRFTGLSENINVSTAHSLVKLNSCHYNSVFTPPFTPTRTPRSQHIPLSFPYPHGTDHQPKLSSPVTTPDSYANGAGKFHRRKQSGIFSISALCACGGPTQIYFQHGTSPALTGSKGNFGFCCQIPSV